VSAFLLRWADGRWLLEVREGRPTVEASHLAPVSDADTLGLGGVPALRSDA